MLANRIALALVACVAPGCFAASPAAERQAYAYRLLAGELESGGFASRHELDAAAQQDGYGVLSPQQPPSSGLFYSDRLAFDLGPTTPMAGPTPFAINPAAIVQSRKLVQSGGIRVEVENGPAAVKTAGAIAQEVGGWIQRADGHSILIRVPAERLEEALDRLAKLGTERDRSLHGYDVTDQHRDLVIRLDNLEKVRLRYTELLAKAENVKSALEVEKELERVTLEIERLKGARLALETNVAFAMLEAQFVDAKTAEPTLGPLGWVLWAIAYGIKWLFIWE
jgi:hypothetical protein